MRRAAGRWSLCLASAVLAWCLGFVIQVPAAEELQVDDIMYRDPLLPDPETSIGFDPRLKQLWLQAMKRPESELQRLAADTIAIAHGHGMPGLASTADNLVELLQQSATVPAVRHAAAHALVALDAHQHASVLVDVARRDGLDLQMVVEPAVARWGVDLLVEEWRQRMTDITTPHRLRMLAIDGLGALRVRDAQPVLLELVLDERAPGDERLGAAQALVAIGQGGMLDEARRLLADRGTAARNQRVLGVLLVSAQQDDEARQMLAELCADPEPAVAGAAIARLFAIDPHLVFPLAPQAVTHRDVNVRRVAVRAMAIQADAAAVTTLAPLLDDPNPGLRRFVARTLFDFAQQAEMRSQVTTVMEQTLKMEGWRGLEQAALLAGHLNHQPAASQLLELLTHRRVEVAVSTAWALGRMKIPETLPRLLEHATAQHARRLDANTAWYDRPIIDAQLVKLFQIFGEMRMMEADELLRKYVPKDLSLGDSRIAACWALGKIHEGHEVTDLIEQFQGRLSDVNSMPPEVNPVRLMCAIGLGRMNANSALQTLRTFAVFGDRVSAGCYWSIERLTGETPPVIRPTTRMVLGWFLQPLDP